MLQRARAERGATTAASASATHPRRRHRRSRPAQPRRGRTSSLDVHRALPRGRRGHHDDEHLHRDERSARPTTRSRASVREHEPRGRAARPRGRRRVRRPFVAGSVGPLNVTLSLSPQGRRPGLPRGHASTRGRAAYAEQMQALRRRRRRPAADRDDLRHAEREGRHRARARGRRLSCRSGSRSRSSTCSGPQRSPGQTVEAFWARSSTREPLIVGVNCSLGRDARCGRTSRSSRRSRPTYVVVPPERRPAERVRRLRRAAGATRARSWASSRRTACVNIVGGCCGTTPEHTHADRRGRARAAAARRSRAAAPRRASAAWSRSRSGRTPAS